MIQGHLQRYGPLCVFDCAVHVRIDSGFAWSEPKEIIPSLRAKPYTETSTYLAPCRLGLLLNDRCMLLRGRL